MMNRNRLGELRARFPGASWAIWSNEFPASGCIEEQSDRLTEFIEARCPSLTPSVILLSSNPDAYKPLGYRNFHSPSPDSSDALLKDIIQDGDLVSLQGAYMTDIVPKAGKVDNTISPENADTAHFLDQLRALEQAHFDIICLCPHAFTALRTRFDASTTSIDHEMETFSATIDVINMTVYHAGDLSNMPTTPGSEHNLDTKLTYLSASVLE